MATKQKTTEESQEKTAVMASPVEQDTAQESSTIEPEKEAAHDEPAQASVETPEASAAPETNVASQTPVLESLSVLADRHRVPGWQQAALARFMGWADGKMLTDDEYCDALKKLAWRHIGGGRRK